MDPDGAPEAAYLRGAAVSYPLCLLAQALLWRSLWADALSDAVAGRLDRRPRRALAGPAGGAAGGRGPVGPGRGAGAAPGARGDPGPAHVRRGDRPLADGGDRGRHARAPRAAARRGQRRLATRGCVAAAPAGRASPPGVTVALVNTPTRLVVAGPPAALDRLHARLSEVAAREEAERRDGRRGGAPLRFTWSPLGVDVPFHSPALAEPLERFESLARGVKRRPRPGRPCSASSATRSARSSSSRCAGTRSPASITELDPDWVLDLGPGTAVARMTAENLRGSGIRTLALASPEGRRVLTSPGAAPADRDVTYARARAARGRAARRARPPRHALHAGDRPAAGDPRRDDADDGRRADRRRRRERGLHDRARRRRAAGPAHVRAARRGAERAARARPRGRVQHAAARSPPVGAAHHARRAAVRRAAGGRAVRGPDRLGRHPGRRGGDRAARPARRRGHARQRVQARHRRAGPAAAGDRRRRPAPHDRRAPRGRPRGRPSLVGGPRGAAARDLPRAAPARERARLRGRRDRDAGARRRPAARHLGARSTARR